MRNILNIIIICLVATVSVNAQMTSTRYAYGQTDAIVSPQSATTTPRYSSPIYEPFSNTLPSEQTEMTSAGVHKGGPRKSKEGNTDPGITDDPNSPIGDALLPLIMALAVYCSVRVYRRKRKV